MDLHATIRQGHRVFASLWLVAVIIGLVYSFTADGDSPGRLGTLVGVGLALMAITDIYMLARPWVLRYRTRGTGS